MNVPAETEGNTLQRFMFAESPVRGAVVQIGSGWRELLAHRDYPADVRNLLGEAMAAAPLLASSLRFEGRLSLQAEGNGPVKLLLVQISHDLEVRGVARHSEDAAGQDLPTLLGQGRFGMIIEPQGRESYQAIVPLTGGRLQDCLRSYFEQSEQLATWLCLAADEESLAGLMLQRMPVSDHADGESDESWARLLLLAGTLQSRELLHLPAEEILHRLFHQETVKLFDPQPVALRCRCSHGRISEMLLSLGRKEIDSILAEQGQIEIECGFCGRRYVYSPNEVLALFDAQAAPPPTESRH